MDAARDKWAQKAEKEKKKELPFVVAALDEERGNWLVVGITGGMEFGNVRKK
jgi:cell division control protein 45